MFACFSGFILALSCDFMLALSCGLILYGGLGDEEAQVSLLCQRMLARVAAWEAQVTLHVVAALQPRWGLLFSGLCDGSHNQLEWQLEPSGGGGISPVLWLSRPHAALVLAILQVAKTRVRVREMKAALHLMQALHRGGWAGWWGLSCFHYQALHSCASVVPIKHEWLAPIPQATVCQGWS